MITWHRILPLLSLISFFLAAYSAVTPHAIRAAQSDPAPCGYVTGFDLPVPMLDTRRTDFAIYRPRFSGLHVGIDVAFEQLGAPVQAAARGRVTYSDTAGWDTEKGVVVIQHTLPDGSLVNTLYGHMEELNGYTFPPLNHCVEQGAIIGAIGFPSRGRPHLHYEIRTRYRHEGGPGYTATNPLELGWLHPIDFTLLARVWIHPAYRQHVMLLESATLPPLVMPDDSYVIARSTHLTGLSAAGQRLWQFDTLGSVTGLVALPDGRVLAATSTNQVLVLHDGSYSTLWQPPQKIITVPILFGDAIVFMLDDYRLMAFNPDGAVRWATDPLPGRAERWAISGERLALATHNNAVWIVDTTGQVLYRETYPALARPFVAAEGEFLLLNDTTLSYLDHTLDVNPLVDTGQPITPEATLLRDATTGTLYFYTGEGRSLYAYNAAGELLWSAYMPGNHLRAPRLSLGGGRLLYALTTDGHLLAYDTQDGHLIAQLTLYNGGIDSSPFARWLRVQADDTVTFSSGYLSVVTLDGLALLTTPAEQP